MLEWLMHFGDIFPQASLLAAGSPTIQIKHSHLLFELRDSDLVTRYPTETTELLIYLCKCVIGHQAADLRAVAARLTALTPALRRSLDEALAHLG